MEVSSEIPTPAAIPVKPIDHEPALHLYLQILKPLIKHYMADLLCSEIYVII